MSSVSPLPPASPIQESRWFEVAWTQISAYKKLIMHLKSHCAYAHVRADSQQGIVLTGTSSIDQLCVEVRLPPTSFSEYYLSWSSSTVVELNMYTFYSIMKRVTAFRCEKVRMRMEWVPQGYYMVTITFETINKCERFHMRASETVTRVAQLDHGFVKKNIPIVALLNTTLLADSFQRFDENSFHTLTLTVHRHGQHKRTVCLETMHDMLTLRGKTDNMQGKVYIPYTMDNRQLNDKTIERPSKYRIGSYLLSTLRSVTRFGTMSPDKMLALHHSSHYRRSPLCVLFNFSDVGFVECYIPQVSCDMHAWTPGSLSDSTSSEEDDIVEQMYRRTTLMDTKK